MFFFFNDTATTEIYTLSLHDALPIWQVAAKTFQRDEDSFQVAAPSQHALVVDDHLRIVGLGLPGGEVLHWRTVVDERHAARSEEHTSELQSH